MTPRQYLVQRDQDHLELVVRLPCSRNLWPLGVVWVVGLPLLLFDLAIGGIWLLGGTAIGVQALVAAETHRLSIRRDRITWDGGEVRELWIEDTRLELDGEVVELDGRLTLRAMLLLRDGIREVERMRALGGPPPVPAEIEDLRERISGDSAEPPSPRR